jgi:myosin-5
MFKKTNVKGEKFLGSKIRKDMEDLMKTLNACDVSFIRCLKPNEIKKPNIFH